MKESRFKGCFCSKAAFTLIELLVVVLIIGILAAVAVPQYQKTVEKSRAVEGMTLVKSVYEAFEHYYLAHGEYPTSFAQLDIEVPGTQITTDSEKEKGRDVYKVDEDWGILLMGTDVAGIMAVRLRGPYAGAGFGMWHFYYSYAHIPFRALVCEERRDNGIQSNLPTYKKAKLGVGAYCAKLFQGQIKKQGLDFSDTFVLP